MRGRALLLVSVILLLDPCMLLAQTTAGTSATIVVPVIAHTSSFGSEVTVFNPNAATISVNPIFYNAQNTAAPGPKSCTSLSVPANVSKAFSVAAQCAVPAGSNFGLLVLTESTGTNRFYGYARTQTPQGIGFSTEGFPIENFNDQIQHATGLKRVAASGGLPAYQTNCFVATLGDAASYQLRLFDGTTGAQLGSTLSGSLAAFQQFRYLDVFAAAGVAAGNYTNVRAQFTNVTGNNKRLIGFCTVQENTGFSADFRIAKSFGGTPQNAFVQGGNAFGTPALIGTMDNQALNVNVNNQRVMRYEPATASPNVIGGVADNAVSSGVVGATIAGGGATGTTYLGYDCGFGCQNSATDHFATIGGGLGNLVGDADETPTNAMFATVGGGRSNTASNAGFVGGGEENEATGIDSVVGGGWENLASDAFTTVAGGNFNEAAGSGSSIGGGIANTASGANSAIPGGQRNSASGDVSFAAGNGANANFLGCFVWADSSADVGEEVRCDGPNRFVARAEGGVYFFAGNDGSNTMGQYTGVFLPPGAQAWVAASDRAGKENVRPVDPVEVLRKVASMSIGTWNWRSEAPSIRHMGPMAQDFHEAFGLGETPRGINTIDADGVALVAIQGLHRLVEDMTAESQVQRDKITEQQHEIESLRHELDAIKRAMVRQTRDLEPIGIHPAP